MGLKRGRERLTKKAVRPKQAEKGTGEREPQKQEDVGGLKHAKFDDREEQGQVAPLGSCGGHIKGGPDLPEERERPQKLRDMLTPLQWKKNERGTWRNAFSRGNIFEGEDGASGQ